MDRLQAYFLTQPPEIVAKISASAMIDYHRLANLEDLPFEESESLFKRSDLMAEELKKFLKEDTHESLKIVIMNSGEAQ